MKIIQDAEKFKNQKKMTANIGIVLTIILLAGILRFVLIRALNPSQNYIEAVERDSPEMKTAELLSGEDGVFLFQYFTGEKFERLTIFVTEYQSGKQTVKNKVADFSYDELNSSSEGMIALVPEFEQFRVKLIVTDQYAKYTGDFPVLDNVEDREHYGRGAAQIEDKTRIRYNSEQGLAAFLYGKDGVSGVSVQEMENGNKGNNNDYVYYVSFEFRK